MRDRALELVPSRGLFISCQAREGSPLRDTDVMARMAAAAEAGGANGIRANGAADVAAITKRVRIPVIGINKVMRPGCDVYITPTLADARPLVEAGAAIVAVDGTQRPRPDGGSLHDLVAGIHALGAPVMVDVDTFDAGIAAAESGADLVATTLSGYTGGTTPEAPDLALVAELSEAIDCPVVAEGRYWTADEVREAYGRGARAVVVGTAVTNPEAITGRLVRASR